MIALLTLIPVAASTTRAAPSVIRTAPPTTVLDQLAQVVDHEIECPTRAVLAAAQKLRAAQIPTGDGFGRQRDTLQIVRHLSERGTLKTSTCQHARPDVIGITTLSQPR